jgi:hypothetical protein
VPTDNPLQRSGHDKVHARDWCAGIGVSGFAPHERRSFFGMFLLCVSCAAHANSAWPALYAPSGAFATS